MISAPDAREAAFRLGLTRSRRGFRGKCPVCGNDTLEARQRDGRTSLVCFYGCDRTELHRAANGEAAATLPTKPAQSDADRTAAALRIWTGAADAHPALTAYCASRSLPGLERSAALRWRADVRHPEAEGLHPAMVALVQDGAGRSIAAHRTYLRRDGSGKADLEPTKASKGPIAGGAIRLDPAGPELVIGEGIETSSAAGRLLKLPAWAAVSAGNMERSLVLPPEVLRVTIAADPDPAGQRAAAGAARRWQAEGRAVRIIVPDGPGDFADVWARRSPLHG